MGGGRRGETEEGRGRERGLEKGWGRRRWRGEEVEEVKGRGKITPPIVGVSKARKKG